MNRVGLQRRLARLTWLLALAGIGYLLWRYDSVRLPAEGCSPLLRYAAGEPLIVDRRVSDWQAGDAVFFHGPDGLLHLASIERIEDITGGERRFWLTTDDRDCPAGSSESFGWIEAQALVARVILVWPW